LEREFFFAIHDGYDISNFRLLKNDVGPWKIVFLVKAGAHCNAPRSVAAHCNAPPAIASYRNPPNGLTKADASNAHGTMNKKCHTSFN